MILRQRGEEAQKLSWTLQGFIKSWGMILLSEIGDKTFFIAAIMAMKNPRRWVRSGCQDPSCSPQCMARNIVAKVRCRFAGILGSHRRPGSNDSTLSGYGMGRAKSGACMHCQPVDNCNTGGIKGWTYLQQRDGSVAQQISKKYTHYGAILLFMYFGLRMLYDVLTGAESVRASLKASVKRHRLGATGWGHRQGCGV